MSLKRSRAIAAAVGALGVVGVTSYRRFHQDIRAANVRAREGSTVAMTRCGPIEYAQIGTGKPLLVVHGAGGGYDQGLLFAPPLAARGIRTIAMSRFGYLRTPLPADASPQAQADAHASLLDALQMEKTTIMGVSAGAPSALQFAIRHAGRCSALILLVPLTWKPHEAPGSVSRPSPMAQRLLEWMVSSDLVFWLALRFARKELIKRVLATPPALVSEASSSERARVDEILRSILPISARANGLRNDAVVAGSLTRYDLEAVRVPTLVVSLRDDLYGTYPGAKYTAEHVAGARFIGYERGGHVWVGHHEELLDEIAALAAPSS